MNLIEWLERKYIQWKRPTAYKYGFIKKEIEEPEIKVVPKPRPTKCEYPGCQTPLTLMSYHCKYCNETHCEKHRLPEDHKCPNPRLPRWMRLRSSSVHYRSVRNTNDE